MMIDYLCQFGRGLQPRELFGRVYPERTAPTFSEDWLDTVADGEQVKYAISEDEPALQLHRQILEQSVSARSARTV
jgi:hypothetical protein